MHSSYYDFTLNINTLNKLFVDYIENLLRDSGFHNVNHTQALLITNIGHETIRVHDINDFDYHLGTNISYSLTNLIKNGYVDRLKNANDKRSKMISLTKKGLEVLKTLHSANVSQEEALHKLKIDANNVNEILVRLQRIF